LKKVLTKDMSAKEFECNYFTVMELKRFCQIQGIHLASDDRKCDIINKVRTFLETGICPLNKKYRRQIDPQNKLVRILDDEQSIGVGFKFTREARLFFEQTLDPSFKCSVPLLDWVKANPQKKISELKEQYMELKSFKGKRTIGKQFEYNRFTRDFFSANPNLSREDCLKCWQKVRELESRKYINEHLQFLN